MVSALGVPLSACASAANDPASAVDQEDEELAAGSLPVVLGAWSGRATVKGGRFLVAGTYPASLHLAQFGRRVRGILEIAERPEDVLAASFFYRVEGNISGGKVHFSMADRDCGAATPKGLCGAGPTTGAFASDAHFTKGKLTFTAARVIDDAKFRPGVVPEPPFAALDLTQKSAHDSRLASFAGRWAGVCWSPESLLLPVPTPFSGNDEMTLTQTSSGLAISAFKDNGKLQDVVSTFGVEPKTNRFWFVQPGGDGGWLYVGRKTGDSLSGVITFAHRYFKADAPPLDSGPATDPKKGPDILLEDVVGVFNFARQR